MDITALTITELKALAYDQLVQIENAQNNLKIINAEIVKRQQEEAKAAEVPEPEKPSDLAKASDYVPKENTIAEAESLDMERVHRSYSERAPDSDLVHRTHVKV